MNKKIVELANKIIDKNGKFVGLYQRNENRIFVYLKDGFVFLKIRDNNFITNVYTSVELSFEFLQACFNSGKILTLLDSLIPNIEKIEIKQWFVTETLSKTNTETWKKAFQYFVDGKLSGILVYK